MYVCVYATWKFSVPRSLCVTHGAPTYSSENVIKYIDRCTKLLDCFEVLCADVLWI